MAGSSWRWWLDPPRLADPEEQRRAHTLRAILWPGTLVGLLLLLGAPLGQDVWLPSAGRYAAFLLVHVVHLALVQAGRPRAAAIGFAFAYFVTATLAAASLGGLRAPTGFLYPPLVLVVGLSWSGRAAIAFAVAASLAMLGMWVLEGRGVLPAEVPVPPHRLWGVATATLMVTAVMLHVALGVIRRSHQSALDAERQLAGIVRAAPDPTLLVTRAGVVTAANPAAIALLGVPAGTDLGARLAQLSPDSDRATLTSAIGSGDGAARVIRLTAATPRWFELRATAMGADVHVSLREITERVRADEDRERLEERLRSTQRLEALGRLAGGVSHDFNNLLTVILAGVGLADRATTPGGAEALAAIEDAAQRAAGLTRQLLSFGRRAAVVPEDIKVDAALERLTPLLRRMLPADLQLVVEYGDAGFIHADPTGLEQVVVNLVGNARDASTARGQIFLRSGRATLTASEAADLGVAPGEHAFVEVVDRGTGMDDETRARVFEPFFTTKQPGVGTGLGLATVHGVVRSHGGFVTVESRPGEGSRFRVHFPRIDATEESVPRLRISVRATDAGRVLVVEDDPAVLRLAAAVLSAGGHQVLTAKNAAEARAVQGGYEVLVTDAALADGTGAELADELRGRASRLAVVFASGHADEVLLARIASGSASTLLAKPYTAKELIEEVARALQRTREA